MKEINCEVEHYRAATMPADQKIDIAATVKDLWGPHRFSEILERPDAMISVVTWDGSVSMIAAHASADLFGRPAALLLDIYVEESLFSEPLAVQECLLRIADSVPYVDLGGDGDEAEEGFSSAFLMEDSLVDVLIGYEIDPYELGIVRTVVQHDGEYLSGLLCDWERDGMKWWAEKIAPLDVDVKRTHVGHPEDLTVGEKCKLSISKDYAVKCGLKENTVTEFCGMESLVGELFLKFSGDVLVPWKKISNIYRWN